MSSAKFHEKDISKFSFLITGGAGFIGSHLAEYFLKNGAAKVRVVDDFSTGLQSNIDLLSGFANFEFINADLSQKKIAKKAVEGINYISHQAALGSIPRSIKFPVATLNANVTVFVELLEAAKKSPHLKSFIYASSSSVYGDDPDLPKKENKTGNPLSPYAVTKRADELFAHVYAQLFSFPIIGFRYFNVFGPRQNPEGPYAAVIPLFIDAMIKGKKISINGDGEQSRDFTFVENAVQANVLALFNEEENIKGKIFNVAAGKKATVNEMFNRLKNISNSNIEPEYVEPRAGDIRHSLADIESAKQNLGYKPKIDLEEGLKITYEWWKKNY